MCGAFWRPPAEAVALAGPQFVAGVCPPVEVVEDRLDGWPQMAGDLVRVLALAGAASGLGDDDLEHAGERDSPQFGDLGRDCLSLSNAGGEGAGLAVGHLEGEPVDGRADGGQEAELAAPLPAGMRRIPPTVSSTNSRMAAAGVVPGARVRIRRDSSSWTSWSRSVTSCSLVWK